MLQIMREKLSRLPVLISKIPFGLRLWFLLLVPFQNSQFFRPYLDLATQLSVNRNERLRWKSKILYVLECFYLLTVLYLWLADPPPVVCIRLSDLVYIAFKTRIFYPCLIALTFMILYFYHVLLFTVKAPFLRLLEDVLYLDTQNVLDGISWREYTPQEISKTIFLVMCNLLKTFIFLLDFIIGLVLVALVKMAFEQPGELFGHPLSSPFGFIWNVACLAVSFFNFMTLIPLYANFLVNLCALGAGVLVVFFLRLHHSERMLTVYRKKNTKTFLTWVPFFQYLNYSGQTFQFLFTANGTMGCLFTAFLLTNLPISAFVLVQLALGGLSRWSIIALTIVPSHELLCCFVLHFAFAKFTQKLHAPSKLLLNLSGERSRQRKVPFRALLKLDHSIVRLHTNDKYGFTYGTIGGLINMASFGQCMLLYTELLMYAYKLIRKM